MSNIDIKSDINKFSSLTDFEFKRTNIMLHISIKTEELVHQHKK